MKYVFTLITLVAFATAQTTTSPVAQENAQKAKTLINQMIQALGGQAYMNIQNLTQQGRTYSFHHGEPNSAGVLFWRFYQYPDKDRVELTKQRDVSYLFSGDKGYEITYKGVRDQDPKDVADYLRRRNYSLDWVLRRWLSQPGTALFYEGQTVAAQKPAEQVTIMNAKNDGVTIYIDLDSHLPVKKTFSWRDPTDKQRNVEDELYDNYREVQGVMTPFSITRIYNGDMSNQRFLNEVKYNQDLSPSLFDATVPNQPKGKH